jgi:hypothetical protein
MVERGTTALLRRGDTTLAACTFVVHPTAQVKLGDGESSES